MVVDGQVFIIDQGFIPEQLLLDLVLGSLGQASLRRALVGDGKRNWILVVGFQKSEKAGLTNFEHFFNVWPGKISLAISLKQYFDLLCCEALVNLCHGAFLSFLGFFLP